MRLDISGEKVRFMFSPEEGDVSQVHKGKFPLMLPHYRVLDAIQVTRAQNCANVKTTEGPLLALRLLLAGRIFGWALIRLRLENALREPEKGITQIKNL